MKLFENTTPSNTRTSATDVVRWTQDLMDLHTRIALRFARPEPRRRALAYLQGIISQVPRKNGWQLAEQAGEVTPYGMQRLLSNAVWDESGVRDDLRQYVIEHLGMQDAILVLDETSFPKRGEKSAGVQVQHCGTTGHEENCQVAVFLDYVTVRGHALIDRELYLPKSWINDRERCREAGIPETVRFQTKCELAKVMVKRIWQAGLPIAWVVADSVYGSNLDLRMWLEKHGYKYVLAVACDEAVGIQTSTGRKRVQAQAVEALLLGDQDWQRLSMSKGTKGERLFDWAVVPIQHKWQSDGCHWLLIRRSISDPTDKTYYLVFAPPQTTLHEMVKAIGARWYIEQDFQTSKAIGLDQYEVRSFIGWYRHVTLVMLAHAFLMAMCLQDQSAPSVSSSSASLQAQTPLVQAVTALTVLEVCGLLARLIWPPPSSATFVLNWSWWRRCHSGVASYYHTKRRLEGG